MLSGAVFLACGILVFSQPLSIRQEVEGLNGDPSWWNGGNLPSSNPPMTPSLLPTLSNTNYKVASTFSSINPDELPEFYPQAPTQSRLDTPIAINSPPSIDPAFQIVSTPPNWVVDFYYSFVLIKYGHCEYGMYTIDTVAMIRSDLLAKQLRTHPSAFSFFFFSFFAR